jgi:hypothetical protein
MTFWDQITLIFAGTIFSVVCNLLLGMWFFRWKKRTEEPSHILSMLREDHDRLEAAFVSHTGITINGRSYKTDH